MKFSTFLHLKFTGIYVEYYPNFREESIFGNTIMNVNFFSFWSVLINFLVIEQKIVGIKKWETEHEKKTKRPELLKITVIKV